MFDDWTHRFDQRAAGVVLASDFSGTSIDCLGAVRLLSRVDVHVSSRNARFDFGRIFGRRGAAGVRRRGDSKLSHRLSIFKQLYAAHRRRRRRRIRRIRRVENVRDDGGEFLFDDENVAGYF